MAGLSSPTAGCVDTTEWPLERELGQCVERERLGSLPVTGLWATLKATTDCGCLCCCCLCCWALPAAGIGQWVSTQTSSKETQVRKVLVLCFLVCMKLMSYSSVNVLPRLSDRIEKKKNQKSLSDSFWCPKAKLQLQLVDFWGGV